VSPVAQAVGETIWIAQTETWRGVLRPFDGRWLLALNDNVGPDDRQPEQYDRAYEYDSFGEALLALILYTGHGDPILGWTRVYRPVTQPQGPRS
jgi:hypothetical protein